jgi:exonuclease SbcC
MLNLLTLTDFQAHKKSVLEFSNGINIIIGETDKGKSSIVRSLDFVIRNDVEDYARHKTDGLYSVELDNVKRVKSKSRNEYHIESEVLKAFGKEPPQDVVDTFKMDSYLNWSLQFDPIFMFSETGGEVARKLNKLVDLNIIITSQTKVNSDIKELNTNSKFNKKEIKDLEKSIEEYMFLPELTRLQRNFQSVLDTENDIKTKIDIIEELKTKADLNHVIKLRLIKMLNLMDEIDSLFDLCFILHKRTVD